MDDARETGRKVAGDCRGKHDHEVWSVMDEFAASFDKRPMPI